MHTVQRTLQFVAISNGYQQRGLLYESQGQYQVGCIAKYIMGFNGPVLRRMLGKQSEINKSKRLKIFSQHALY